MAKKNKNSESSADEDFFKEMVKETGGDIVNDIDSVSYFVDTGNLAVNYICSGKFTKGGVPGGKLTEIYGPSSSSKSLFGNNILFGCQKLNGIPILLDAENSANKEFIQKASHINLKKIAKYNPPSLEQAFAKIIAVTTFIRSKKGPDIPIVIIYDSITVSPCERELREVNLPEGYTQADFKRIVGSKSQPGERARVCSAELRKLNSFMETNNVTVVILNQIRSKIGVMYGCFHYDTRVVLADGSTMKIGKIVNQNMVGLEVLSYNSETGIVEPKKIIECHDNGNISNEEKFLQFKVRKKGGNGFTQFACTSNHQIFVPGDKIEKCREVPAGELEIGDEILVTQPHYLNEDQKQVVYGSILGDGSLREVSENGCVQLRIDHGIEQADYCRWKEEIFNPWVGYSFTEDKKVGFDTIPMYELIELAEYKNVTGECVIPGEILDNFDKLALAVWYMDDGTYRPANKWGNGQSVIYCTKFKNRELLQDMLKEKFGLVCKIFDKGFKFDSENTKKLHDVVSPYVHPNMRYKLHNSYGDDFKYEIEEPNGVVQYEAISSEIVDIYEKPVTRSKKKFDLTIEGNHSYVVDGAIVHNSPETTGGGGNALEFYASCRLRPQTQKKIEQKLSAKKKKILGINVKMVNKKNKTHRPFIESDGIQLTFDKGINPLGGLLSCLLDAGRIEASGKGNYSVKEPYANGVEVKFKGSLDTNNTVPLEVLLKCPSLIDADTEQEVTDYLEPYKEAMNFEVGDDIVESDVGEDDEDDVDDSIDAELN